MLSHPVFSAFDFALTNHSSFVYKVLTLKQLTHRPFIKFRALPQKLRASKRLNRCQNTAPSSLEKQTLVVSLGELKPRKLNSKTRVYLAQVSTDSESRNRHAECAMLFQHPTHARARPCHGHFSPRPPRGHGLRRRCSQLVLAATRK